MKNKKDSYVWGVAIAPVSKLNDNDEKNIPISVEEWASLSSTMRLPSRQIRGRCNATGESINMGVVEELPKIVQNRKAPPAGPRIKKLGGINNVINDIDVQKSSQPYYNGEDEGDLCRYSAKGVFELNLNDQWVKDYFFKGDAIPTKKDKDLRINLFKSLLIRAKTIAITYNNYDNNGEIGGQKINVEDFINRSLIVQVREDPLILEVCKKIDDE